ncbi:MAG TPA: vitamin K epoxide reductase family protein [Candidatus Saccharimonadales bacterium]
MKIFTKNVSLQKTLPWLLVVAGAIGLLCSLIIMYDKVELLKNPAFRPNCDLNPIISCGSVMESKQANAFGFPNPFIGIAGFSMVMAAGMALLAGAGKLKRWFWLCLNGGTLFGLGFIHWLFFESVYHIQALCPYCMGVWTVTIALFWYVTLYNIQTGVLPLRGRAARIGYFARRHHLDILLLWYLAIAALILKHFWYYYGQHFHI